MLARLAAVLGLPLTDLATALAGVPRDSAWPVRLRRGPTFDDMARVEAWRAELPRGEGSAVVLDPRNGDRLAMASSPAFDPARFAGALDRDEWLRLVRDPQHPLLNRAFQAESPAGSIFKLVVAAAALQEGVITPEARLPCPPA